MSHGFQFAALVCCIRFASPSPAGALSRVIDRGTRGINFILSSMVFNVVPTLLEIMMVTGILTYKCGPSLTALTMATIGGYTAFTLSVTSWRMQVR